MISSSGEGSKPGTEAQPAVERWLLALLIVTVAAGVFLRFSNLEGKICWYDECYSRLRIAGFGRPDVLNSVRSNKGLVRVDEFTSLMHSSWKTGQRARQFAMLREDFQNSPLYYWTARLWVELFGEDVGSLRLFSAVVSLLWLPLVYLLCLELFGSRRTACITLCLVASSPAFLIYAQQIRHYSVWIVTVLLCCLTMLRSVRLNTGSAWATYSLSLGLSFLANPLSLVLAAGHGVFVCLRSKLKPSREVGRFALSVLLASLAFAPRFFLSSFDVFTGSGAEWLATPPTGGLVEYIWEVSVRHWPRLFWEAAGPSRDFPGVLAAAASICLIALAVLNLNRQGTPDQKLFLNSLIVVGVGAFVLRDAVLLGRSATITRYLFPALIGIELALGFLLSVKTAPGADRGRPSLGRAWIGLFIAVLSIGLYGSVKVSAARSSWATWGVITNCAPVAAEAINRVAGPVILIPTELRAAYPLVLAVHLKPDAVILPVNSAYTAWPIILRRELLAGRPVLMWDPGNELAGELGAMPDLLLSQVEKRGRLWKVELKPYTGASPPAGRSPGE
jgi:uncharacterized membrane protein